MYSKIQDALKNWNKTKKIVAKNVEKLYNGVV